MHGTRGQKPSIADETTSAKVLESLKLMEASMAKMNGSLFELKGEVAKMRSEMDIIADLKNSLQHSQSEIVDLKNNTSDLKVRVDKQDVQHTNIMIQLNDARRENLQLKEQLLKLDSYIRRENLKFSGISEDNNESALQCRKKIWDLFVNKLEIDHGKDIEFQRCHRMGPKPANGSQTRDIIVRFIRYGDREHVWNQRNKLRGSGVFINEDFPPEIEGRRKRLYPVYKAAKGMGHKVSFIADKLIIDGRRYGVENLDTLPQALQPSALAVREIDNCVLFHGRDAVFSSFHNSKFTLQDNEWTVEQYFQFEKAKQCGDDVTAEAIKKSQDPIEQHRLGRKVKVDPVSWTNERAKQIMEAAVLENFTQNDVLKKKLLETGNKQLILCNQFDKFWGNGLRLGDVNAHIKTEWKGQNAFGAILVAVRDSLK